MAERFYVLFTSSFRYEAALNISHETVDKQRTLCGRKVSDAATFEPDSNDLEPDCNSCRKTLAKLKSALPRDVNDEAPLRCSRCSPGHELGSLQAPCKITGCECWCNR